MLGQKRLDAVGAEPPTVHVGEQSCCSLPYWLLEPCLEGLPGDRGQRSGPLLPPFADTAHMSTGAEVDVVPVEANQFGEAQACLGRNQQQCAITATQPSRRIGRSK